jgi:hypothetical protein
MMDLDVAIELFEIRLGMEAASAGFDLDFNRDGRRVAGGWEFVCYAAGYPDSPDSFHGLIAADGEVTFQVYPFSDEPVVFIKRPAGWASMTKDEKLAFATEAAEKMGLDD